MATTIITKYGSGAPTTSDVQRGELAVDTENGRLYTLNSSNAVVEIGVNTASNLDVTGTVTADGLTVDGTATISTADNSAQLTLISTDTDALVGPQLNLWRNSGTGTNGDLIGQITFTGEDTVGSTNTFASIHAVADQADNGAEDGSLHFGTMINGSLADRLVIDSAGNVGIGVSSLVTGSTRRVLQVSTGSDGGQLALADSTTEAANPRIFATNKEDLKLSTANTATGTIQFITGSTPTERLRIDSSGAVVINNSGGDAQLYLGGTSGTSRMYLARSGADSLLWNVSNGAMKFGTNDAERMRIDRVGSVGIGVTPPAQTDTNAHFLYGGGTNGFVVSAAEGPAVIASNVKIDTSQKYIFNGFASKYYQLDGAHVWQTAASGTAGNAITFSTPMTLDASGNLLVSTINDTPGLGDTDVGASFRADGASFVSRTLSDTSGSTLYVNRNTYDGNLVQFQKDGTTVGSIGVKQSDSATGDGELFVASGNTGLFFDDVNNYIRPANASGALRDNTVDLGEPDSRFKDLYLSGNTQMGGNLDVVGQISSYDNVGASYGTMNVRALDIIYKSSGGAERMRLDSSGNLLVGTSSSVARIHASISSASLPAVAFENTNTGSSGVGVITTSVPSTANNTNCFHLKSTTQGVASYYLYGNGSSSFTSDERQKKNIVTTRDGYLDDLKNLRVVDYHWNNQEDTEDKSIGLIAQEVEQVFPHLVVEHELEGAGVRKNLKGSDFTFILIKAIQEQQDLIESLTARIAALEGAN